MLIVGPFLTAHIIVNTKIYVYESSTSLLCKTLSVNGSLPFWLHSLQCCYRWRLSQFWTFCCCYNPCHRTVDELLGGLDLSVTLLLLPCQSLLWLLLCCSLPRRWLTVQRYFVWGNVLFVERRGYSACSVRIVVVWTTIAHKGDTAFFLRPTVLFTDPQHNSLL